MAKATPMPDPEQKYPGCTSYHALENVKSDRIISIQRLFHWLRIRISKRWQVMNGTVADDRERIHTELRHFAHALKFALAKNKTQR